MECMKNVVHGFMLALANFISIWLGFVIYYIIKASNQRMIQLPVAVILSCILFSTYIYIYSKTKIGKNNYISIKNGVIIYMCSLIVAPIIFIPVHFITQGYLTSLGNIIPMLKFQVITNIIALYLSSIIGKSLFDRKEAV
jgi:hypothetical protein